MSNTIYLYLKTHNITGLKYLGKTTKDPYAYKGSGVYWTNHIKKHGDDISTEILYQTECKDDFKKIAIKYSEEFDIVKSKEFANMMIEQGQGGATSGSWKRGHIPSNKGKTMNYSEEVINNIKLGRKLYFEKWHKNNTRKVYIKKGPNREAMRKNAIKVNTGKFNGQNNNARPVIVHGIKYNSRKEAAKANNTYPKGVLYRCRSTKEEWKDWVLCDV